MDNTTNTNEIIENASEVVEPVIEAAESIVVEVGEPITIPDKKGVIALAVTGTIIIVGGTIYALRKPLGKLGHNIKERFSKKKEITTSDADEIQVDCDVVSEDDRN